MNQFLDILLLASFVIGGVYSLWTAVQMRRWKELKPNKFIYPNGCEPVTVPIQRGSGLL